MSEIKTSEVLDILNKIKFINGQRAGRELWMYKPIEVQNKDLADFNRDIEIIKEYIESKNADWIPCEEKLPPQPKENPLYENKPLQVYLVSVNSCEEPFRAFWNGKNFTDGWSKLKVEAWMNLPQPYKKEGNSNANT